MQVCKNVNVTVPFITHNSTYTEEVYVHKVLVRRGRVYISGCAHVAEVLRMQHSAAFLQIVAQMLQKCNVNINVALHNVHSTTRYGTKDGGVFVVLKAV